MTTSALPSKLLRGEWSRFAQGVSRTNALAFVPERSASSLRIRACLTIHEGSHSISEAMTTIAR